MKAADGMQIVERWADEYFKISPFYPGHANLKKAIEELSRAEERERVLEKALERIASDFESDYVLDGVVVDEPANTHRVAWIVARAALTAAPEQGKEAKS